MDDTEMEDKTRSFRGKYRNELKCGLEKNQEYSRINRILAKAEAVKSGLSYILWRSPVSIPKWIILIVQSNFDRINYIIKELVEHRDERRL
jgi:hypothetical protein